MPETRHAQQTDPATPELAAVAAPEGLEEWRANVAFYRAHLPEWAEHQGKHILVYRDQAHGFYPTRVDALQEGLRRFGDVTFLVKQVDLEEKPEPLVGVIL